VSWKTLTICCWILSHYDWISFLVNQKYWNYTYRSRIISITQILFVNCKDRISIRVRQHLHIALREIRWPWNFCMKFELELSNCDRSPARKFAISKNESLLYGVNLCLFLIFYEILRSEQESLRVSQRAQNWHVNNNVQLQRRNPISLSKPGKHPIKHRKHNVSYFFSLSRRNFFNFKVKSRFNKI